MVNGSAVATVGAAAGLTYSGTTPLTLGRPVQVDTGYVMFKALDTTTGGSVTLDQPITGAGSVSLQGVIGGAEIHVTGTNNTYTGTTRFATGNVHIAGDGSLGAGGGWQFAGGALILEGDVTNSRHVNFSSSGSIIDTNGHNATFNGPLTSFLSDSLNTTPPGGFTKNGLGTLTITNPANTVPGVITVNAGTLLVNGNLGASTSSAVTVNSGATLGGSGTIYRNTTIAGGTLSPGNSPGVITIAGTLTMGSGSTLNMELNGADAGSGYDQVVASSSATSGATVVLGAGVANLGLSLGFAPANGSKFWLINNTSTLAGSTTGNFAGLPEGSALTLGTFGGQTFTAQISYTGNYATGQVDGSGNDVVLYNVGGGCGSADFNCDGDLGTDADIEAFFACLAGSCPPPPCMSNADFNGDGDLGTDADIEAFFRVLAGGSC